MSALADTKTTFVRANLKLKQGLRRVPPCPRVAQNDPFATFAAGNRAIAWLAEMLTLKTYPSELHKRPNGRFSPPLHRAFSGSNSLATDPGQTQNA